jgi:hypothetical protein
MTEACLSDWSFDLSQLHDVELLIELHNQSTFNGADQPGLGPGEARGFKCV